VRPHHRRTPERIAGLGPFPQVPIRQFDDRLTAFVGLPHYHEILRPRPAMAAEDGLDGAEDGAVGADG
jgi:hypothetical protein